MDQGHLVEDVFTLHAVNELAVVPFIVIEVATENYWGLHILIESSIIFPPTTPDITARINIKIPQIFRQPLCDVFNRANDKYRMIFDIHVLQIIELNNEFFLYGDVDGELVVFLSNMVVIAPFFSHLLLRLSHNRLYPIYFD